MKSLAQLQNLHGRVCLITGGAGHLGKMFAEVAAELGADLALIDTQPSPFASELAARFSVRCEAFAIDLADHDLVAALPTRVAESFGRLDVLVNNAAFTGNSRLDGWAVPFAEQSSQAWLAALDVNLHAPFLLAQKAAPFLAAHHVGAIVNVASIYGVVAPDFSLYEGTNMANPAAYNASKGGLIQLTRYLATVLAPDIRVNSLSPGGISRNQPASFVERYETKTPLRRMAREEDFKGVAALLMSDLGAYITGQNLIVDGGWTTW